MKSQLNQSINKINSNYYYFLPFISLLCSIFLLIQIPGCVTPKRVALPKQYVDSAEVPGMSKIRDWGDKHSEIFQEDLTYSIRQEIDAKHQGDKYEDDTINILTLSAGGADSAFAAGLINGWDAAGTRPTFKLVTGISAGSLIAPFAFLGGKYDQLMGEIITSIATDDLLKIRPIISILWGADSVGDSSPLANLITHYVDEDMLKDIAKAHAEGRRLFLGTTNLDTQRLVIWNMGAIASSKNPNAPELFRNIMKSSASIPIVFPPLLLEIEADGKTYDEMHVDGGVASEIFFYGDLVNVEKAYKDVGITPPPKQNLFIINKSLVQTHYEPTERTLLSIGSKTISSMLKAKGIGDIYRIHAATRREGINFNLASIPYEWDPDPHELFDPDDMQRLYNLGYNLAKSGLSWQKYPPH